MAGTRDNIHLVGDQRLPVNILHGGDSGEFRYEQQIEFSLPQQIQQHCDRIHLEMDFSGRAARNHIGNRPGQQRIQKRRPGSDMDLAGGISETVDGIHDLVALTADDLGVLQRGLAGCRRKNTFGMPVKQPNPKIFLCPLQSLGQCRLGHAENGCGGVYTTVLLKRQQHSNMAERQIGIHFIHMICLIFSLDQNVS